MSSLTWKYVKELKNESAIENFEKNQQVHIPNDLKEIISKYNNGRPSLRYFDLGNEKGIEFKKLLSFNSDDKENIFEFLSIDSQHSGLLPFADDISGNLLCLYKGKIYFWNHESDTLTFLADTFSEFLATLY